MDPTAASRLLDDRRRAEEDLRHARERADFLSRAIEDASQPFASGHPDGSLMLINHAFVELTGYSEAELRSLSWATDLTPPEWRQHEAEVLKELHNTGKPQTYQKEYLRKDGSRVPVEISVNVVFDDHRNPRYYYAFVTDITDRRRAEEALRRSEERFAAFMDYSPAISWITDSDGRIVYMSKAYEKTFTLPHVNLLGKLPHEIYPPQFAEHYLASIRKVAQTGEAIEVEETGPLADGSYGVFRVFKFPLRDRSGPTLVGGVAIDITANKNAERERERALHAERSARAEAEAANLAKDRFLAALSHELRTPLTPVALAVTAMEIDPRLPPEFRDDLSMIRRNVELETRLIDDLLDLSRVISGKLRLNRRPASLQALIRHVLHTVGAEIHEKSLAIRTDFAAPRDTVDVDAARLQQVLWNFLKNASKFTPEGGAITVRTFNDPATPGTVSFEVSDTGCGIDPHLLPKVFEPFEQGDPTVTRRYGGMGLGLAIAKGIVDLHGGSIHATSDGVGQGATFTVSLPLHSTDPTAAATPAISPANNAERPLRLLLVEDHADTAKTLARLLRLEGIDVHWAATIADALHHAANDSFDLLISDLGLPDGSGHDLLRELRSRILQLPAIAMSGYGMDEDMRQSRDAGFAEHLTKPINIPQLRQAIHRVLQK